MPVLTGTEFTAKIKLPMSGAYILCGEEGYLIDYYRTSIRKSLFGEADDPFNHILLDASEDGLEHLAEHLASPPFFAEKKLVELTSFDAASLTEAKAKELKAALESIAEDESLLLIITTAPDSFDFGSVKRPGKHQKLYSPCASIVEFPLESPQKLTSWVGRHFTSRKIISSPELCRMLVDRTGRSMRALANEIEKLCAYLGFLKRDTLTAEDIMLVTCVGKEEDPFEFSGALLDGDSEKSLALLADMKARREAPEMILAGMIRVYCDLALVRMLSDGGAAKSEIASSLKMHEYKTGLYLAKAREIDAPHLKRAIEACFETDLKMKSTPLEKYMLLDRLCVMLCILRAHAKGGRT